MGAELLNNSTTHSIMATTNESKDNHFQLDSQMIAEKITEFVRIADVYYQRVFDPNKGCYSFIKRDKYELKGDGVEIANSTKVMRFHGFANDPDNIRYKRNIHGFFNLYEEILHVPKEGYFLTIEKLLKHIFGEQYEFALDYYTILWKYPKQLLPIVVVVSKEQGTAKTTLLEFNKFLFGANAVTLNVSQYCQQFNGIFASKLMIGIDETAIKEEFIKERLKQDSTAQDINLRKMHTDYQTIPFFGKFALATNKEHDFAKMENEDVRFWVRKVSKFDVFDPHFKDKLKKEIPAFIHFLENREIITPNKSRQWFTQEDIRTAAFDAIVENSKSECAKDIIIWAEEILANKDNFGVTVSEIYEALGRKYSRNQISEALRKEVQCTPPEKTIYYADMCGIRKSGKAYIFGMLPPPENDTAF